MASTSARAIPSWMRSQVAFVTVEGRGNATGTKAPASNRSMATAARAAIRLLMMVSFLDSATIPVREPPGQPWQGLLHP